jgi:hypothetical protein
MAPSKKRATFWRLCRIYFRRFRIAVWLIVLAVVGCLLYLDQVGLPGFVKKPILNKLRAQGIDLQFSRLRLRRLHEVVAENVVFGSAQDSLTPQLTIREVQVLLNHHSLLHFRLDVDSLALRHGRLALPIAGTNQPSRELSVSNIQTQLRFLPEDSWRLDHFTAEFAGASVQLSGTVTNASALRELSHGQKPTPAGLWQDRLRQIADILERIHFAAPPVLHVRVYGDARDLQSFDVRLALAAPGADSPWGNFKNGRLTARLFAATTNEFSRAELNLEAGEAGWANSTKSSWAATTNVQIVATFASAEGETNWANAGLVIRAQEAATRWGNTTNLLLTLDLAPAPGRTNLVNGNVSLSAANIQTPWADAANARFSAEWLHAMTNPIPLSGHGRLECDHAATERVAAGHMIFTAHMAEPTAAGLTPADASWGFWDIIQPYLLDWEAELSDVRSPRTVADRIVGQGHWRAPNLVVTNLHADLYHGSLDIHAELNVATRAAHASLASTVDPHRISPLLFDEEPRWLAASSWEKPPELKADASLILPEWTNQPALTNWRAEAQPSLRFLGEITIATNAAYHGASFTTAHSHLIYSNLFWRLPDLLVTRPEGRLEAAHESSDVTGAYSWHISSTINPAALRPLFETNQQPALDYFKFTQPPLLIAEVRGRGSDPERVGAKGRVVMNNFTFRGETISSFQTAFQYTNRVLQFMEPRIQRGVQQLNAGSLIVDFNAEKIFLTNGFGTMDPMVVARAIGPHIVRVMQPYQFTHPPTVRGQGVLPIRGEEAADFVFDVLDGGEFHWSKFTVPQIRGKIYWHSHRLNLSEVYTKFYDGQATGSAAFNFQPPGRAGMDYQFALATTNTSLQKLVTDLFPGTNRLEGSLSGVLYVTSANTADEDSVEGYGNVTLRDGLIWNFPVFGVFSPVLNGIYPGMGNSRATAATGHFRISNSVVHSDDLDIRTTGMRLQYRGNVDLEGRVNARAEGSLLRDMPIVGTVVSTVFWPVTKLFEYKVTGTLKEPKTEPLYFIPKIVLFPFHPFRTHKDLATESNVVAFTNSPPLNATVSHSFGIYLPSQPVDKRMITKAEGDWSRISLAESPVISDADIIEYDFSNHSMKLRPEALARVPRPPVDGTPFVVVANGEPTYLGAFVTSASSMSFAVPVIEVDRRAIFTNQPPDTLVIDRAYPQPSTVIGPDPRNDLRIIQALSALQKIKI